MKHLRLLVTLVAGGCVANALPSAALAQAYPSKPIRVLIATSAGSNPDTVARIVATRLGPILGQQIIVDNRAGAGGNIGAEIAARAPADGYTVFSPTPTPASTPHCTESLPTTSSTISRLSRWWRDPRCRDGSSSLPAKSLRDLINIAKSRPGDLITLLPHRQRPFFRRNTSTVWRSEDAAHRLKAAAPRLPRSRGRDRGLFHALRHGLPHIRSGRLRPLGVSTLSACPTYRVSPPSPRRCPATRVLAGTG